VTTRLRPLAAVVLSVTVLTAPAAAAASRPMAPLGGAVRVRSSSAPGAALPPAPARPLFGQQWSPWGREPLGSSRVTVAGYGCALTASAMLLRTFGVNLDPGQLDRWLVDHGGFVAGDLLVWGAVARAAAAAGVSVRYDGWRPFDRAAIYASLAHQDPVIAQVRLDGNMHFVLIVAAAADGTMWINDPWYGDVTTLQARYGEPARAILSIRLYSGTAVAPPTVTALRPGVGAAIRASAGGLGPGGSGAEVLAVPDTTPTTLWTHGTPAQLESWTTSAVDFVAPTPLSAGSLVVRTPTGQPNYWFPFTVPGEAAVQVTSVTPAAGAVQGGTRVLIRGSGFIAPMSVRFGTTPARAAVVLSPTLILAVSPPAAGGRPRPGAPAPRPTTAPSAPAVPSLSPTPAGAPSASPRGTPVIPPNPYAIRRPGAARKTSAASRGLRVTLTVADWMGSSPGGAAARFAYTLVPGAPASPTPTETVVPSPTVAPSPTPEAAATPSESPSPTPQPPPAPTVRIPLADAFHTVGPTPLLDTSTGLGSSSAALEPGSVLRLALAGVAGVPRSGAALVALQVTATAPGAAGAVTFAPAGGAAGGHTALAVPAGEPASGLVLVAPGGGGAITVTDAGGRVGVVSDVVGWFGRGPAGAGRYQPLPPTVVCDTDPGAPSPCAGQTLEAGRILAVPLDGHGGVPPTGAAAVLLDVTVSDPAAGSLSLYPAGTSPSGDADLRFGSGESEQAEVVVPLGLAGFVCITDPGGPATVRVAVAGWFAAG